MTAPDPGLQREMRWDMRIARGLWILSLGLVIVGLGEYVRDVPDSYHNEKSRSLSIALVLFFSNFAEEFRPRPMGWTLKAAALIALGATIWFSV